MVQNGRYPPGSFQKVVDATLHPPVPRISSGSAIVVERLAEQRHSRTGQPIGPVRRMVGMVGSVELADTADNNDKYKIFIMQPLPKL